ncbi:hypothetical protein KAFR_0A00880 [Kazachstania africana CBS 2517]|uniref:UBX domain-containing protein n=1 Tax=Kazachstania africana (strain ATCC 22294 / BCRC 22015 / CBS 2517 / CECT 1963 / NBRC 1671 / NRRL Y-8276) TaxID=1071382 RepID=H2AMC6_KAZAF|nr:hypothetical protein KAFR_0A00880 [Kazachstania africana CBS 2517]CCF55526.1 hypothetical protein KAFR_0A00880 [Kazachstania africana CBS 2517]
MATNLFLNSVEEAVQLSNVDSKPLVVYNTFTNGDDTWLNKWFKRDESLNKQLLSAAIWLKLSEGTTQFAYFAQIFPSVIVPSLYIILNGQIKTIIQGEDSAGHWNELSKALSIEIPVPRGPVHPEQTFRETIQHTTQEIYQREKLKERRLAEQEHDRILKLLKADKEERKAMERQKMQTNANTDTNNDDKIYDNIKDKSRLHTVDCTLLIRLTNGRTLTHTFHSSKTLNDVRSWVDQNRVDDDVPYVFHRNVPRLTFTESDEMKSLESLDLTPRSALILKPIEGADKKLNISHAQGPSLLGKVYNGLSSWWSNNDDNSSDAQCSRSEDLHHSQANIMQKQGTNHRVNEIRSADIDNSSMSSFTSSPLLPSTRTASNFRSSEQNISSRSVSPNIYQFLNPNDDKQDEDDEKSAYNGNAINLEKKKDDD